jgi:hypothetical protein
VAAAVVVVEVEDVESVGTSKIIVCAGVNDDE